MNVITHTVRIYIYIGKVKEIYRVSFILDMIYFKVSTRLSEGNTLPYQETQAFKDVICEFRNKMVGTEKSLMSLSQRADEHKDLRQLFPPKNENRREVTTIFDKVVDTFKVN